MSEPGEKLKGRFIVIDGPDGAGKSTQLARLGRALQGDGVDVVAVRDPGGTRIGDRIREILLDADHREMCVRCELMLYMASRAQLIAEVVRPALQRGACVLGDRFITSTVAYQGAGGADPDVVRRVGEIAVEGVWPDLTIILDVPAAVGLARLTGTPDRIEAKDRKFHDAVRELFLGQAREAPGAFAVVDATGEVDDTERRVRAVLDDWQFPERDQ